MIDTIFFILTMIPILFYFIWRIGYNLRRVKILLVLSIVGSIYFFFNSIDFAFIIEDSLNNVIEKLIFLNLFFFSTLFTMIVLIVPSNQNIYETLPSLSIQESKDDFIPLVKWNSNNNMIISTSIENEIKEEGYFIRDGRERSSEIPEEGQNDDEFQKLINNIFENQHKSQKGE